MPNRADTELIAEFHQVVEERINELWYAKREQCTDQPLDKNTFLADFKNKVDGRELRISQTTYHRFVQLLKPVQSRTANDFLLAIGFHGPEERRRMLTLTSTRERNKIEPVHRTAPIRNACSGQPTTSNPPRAPSPFLGRDRDIERINKALGIRPESDNANSKVISVYGDPGVGKSTIAAWLANNPDILAAFPDAVLWSAFGLFDSNTNPDFEVRERLRSWGYLLSGDRMDLSMQTHAAAEHVAHLLKQRRALLICDDVWRVDDVLPILSLAAGDVRLLITSRHTDLAKRVVSYPDSALEMKGFEEYDAISFMNIVAPTVMARCPTVATGLVRDLEFNPLAIKVAGHLLEEQMAAGLDIAALAKTMRDRILNEPPPVSMMELVRETNSPTIAAWLERSIRVLDPEIRSCFVSLGYLARRPAIFRRRVLEQRWEGKDVQMIIRKLIGAGVLQLTSDGKYQMHALLVTLAESMAKESQS